VCRTTGVPVKNGVAVHPFQRLCVGALRTVSARAGHHKARLSRLYPNVLLTVRLCVFTCLGELEHVEGQVASVKSKVNSSSSSFPRLS
jgi:hypothetical protein